METSHVGIEIGGTKLQVVLGDELGGIQRRWRANVDQSRGGAGIRDQIQAFLTEIPGRVAAAGVGFGGPVDWRTGETRCSHQVEGWSHFPLGKWLSDRIQAPVRIDNDANVACLGEAWHGAGQEANPVFYVTLGSGVGGGMVVDRQIYHGAIPGESEIGHIRLDRQGMTVESRCSGWAVDARVRKQIALEPQSLLARIVGSQSGGEARFLRPAFDQGDSEARRLLEEVAGDLAFGLSHVVHLIHPQTIVLGGGLSLLGEPLVKAVASGLEGFIMEAFTPAPRVVCASLGEDVVPVGALVLARLAGAKA